MNCCSVEKGGSCCKFRKSKGIYKSHGSTGPAGHPCQGGRLSPYLSSTRSPEPKMQGQMPVWVLGRLQAQLQLASWIMIQHQTRAASTGA